MRAIEYTLKGVVFIRATEEFIGQPSIDMLAI
jgi:hypothetical protein